MNIPVSHSTVSLERLFQHILDAPIPEQVSISYLRNSGFHSGHDPELRLILRILGFLRDDDTPTSKLTRYKTEGKKVLQEAVQEVYKDLFVLYPNAPFGQSNEDLKRWFNQFNPAHSKSFAERAIRAFKKLCQLADIKPDVQNSTQETHELQAIESFSYPPSKDTQTTMPFPSLPVSENTRVYKAIFEAIKDTFYSD